MAFKKAREWLTQTGVLASRPAAFVVFALYGLSWIALGDGLKWHSIATLATWGMTLVIQRAEHRDTQAIHAKLDELLKADGAANNKVMRIDDKDAEEVETARREVRASWRHRHDEPPAENNARQNARNRCPRRAGLLLRL
jgi:low affinity Fe/Cu permease